jgi:MFS family permease
MADAMTESVPETYSWRLQGAVYGTGFFNGSANTMAAMVVALLVGQLISTEFPFLIAIVFASRQILTVTMSIYGGALMDRFGTRRIVILFGLTGVVAAILYPALPAIFGLPTPGAAAVSPTWLFVAAIILLQAVSGYAEGTGWIGTQTLVSQTLRGHPVYAGRMTFIARIGGIMGPLAIGAAWDEWGPLGGFGFLAVWILCGVAAALFLPKTHNGIPGGADTDTGQASRPAEVMPRASDYAATLRLLLVPAVAMVIMITMMRQTGSGVQSTFYVIWLDKEIGLSGILIGTLLGASSAASAFAALTVGPLTRRFTTHWLLIVTIGISIVGIAVTPALGDFYTLLLIVICARGVGQGLNLPLMITILARNVPQDLIGRVTAMRISFNRLGGAVVPLVMGALAEIVGIANSFYIVGAVGMAMLAVLAIWVARSPSFRDDEPTNPY